MRRAAVVLLPPLAILLIAIWRAAGPGPVAATAPAGRFSAERAWRELEMLAGKGEPRPIGGEANARLRAKLVSRLQSLGYRVSVQKRFACSPAARCGMVHNVVARHPGSPAGPAVLAVAHYDSVPASTGASDDLMGVAALLEVARAVRDQQHRNPVIFLIDDGEEEGLLGAEAFVAAPELSSEVRAVVNLENRGTFGASNMFETSAGNLWLIRHLAHSLERPQASSLFYAIYQILPNDTDVSVFRRTGLAAVNFAAIRGVQWYHTPLDDLEHASRRTLQHHGENALAMVRELANADLGPHAPETADWGPRVAKALPSGAAGRAGLDESRKEDATYFDLLGFTLVWWPQSWTGWLLVACVAALIVAMRRTPLREVLWGFVLSASTILVAGISGFGLMWVARRAASGLDWVAQPAPAIVSMWLIGAAVALGSAAAFRRKARPEAVLLGTVILWLVVASALLALLPGASYLFLVPAAAALLTTLLRGSVTVCAVIATNTAAVLLFPIAFVLYDALGLGLLAALAIVVGAIATWPASLFPSARAAAVLAALAVGTSLVSFALPEATADHPRAISIAWVDDSASASPLWSIRAPTDPLLRVASFAPSPPEQTPWTRARAWVAPAPQSGIPRVELTAVRNGDRVEVHVRSPRNADRLTLWVRGGVRVLTVNGVAPPERTAPAVARPWRQISAAGVTEMRVELAAPSVPLDLVAGDVSWGLPASGEPLRRARSASSAVPVGDGDVTVTRVRRRV